MSGSSPRCRVVPLPDHKVSIEVDGKERLRWHFGFGCPRPFFYPLIGPTGHSLVRMGHPGAPDHDHHRGVWFAHHDVQGTDFWSDQTSGRIEQKQWLCYDDGDEEAVMAVRIGWYAASDGPELLDQELVAAVRPGSEGELFLELQSTFRSAGPIVTLGKTNFGLLAVRVAKSISAYFGGGQLSASDGRRGEAEIFGDSATWVDYSGPVAQGVIEGLTYFGHPSNPGEPAHWHVREDGWMGSSLCMHAERVVTPDCPLAVRYLLHVHRGPADEQRATQVLADFSSLGGFQVERSSLRHTVWSVRRVG